MTKGQIQAVERSLSKAYKALRAFQRHAMCAAAETMDTSMATPLKRVVEAGELTQGLTLDVMEQAREYKGKIDEANTPETGVIHRVPRR